MACNFVLVNVLILDHWSTAGLDSESSIKHAQGQGDKTKTKGLPCFYGEAVTRVKFGPEQIRNIGRDHPSRSDHLQNS